MSDNRGPKINKWVFFGMFVVFSAFMYVTIMYKIVNFGP